MWMISLYLQTTLVWKEIDRMHRILLSFALAAIFSAGISRTAGAQNIFNLVPNPASPPPLNLQRGDVLKLDVWLISDATFPINNYQTVIAFDPDVFDPATPNSEIYTRNPNSPFDIAQPTSKGNMTTGGDFSRVFRAGEAFSNQATQTFSLEPTLLGTFNLTILDTSPFGESWVGFSDVMTQTPLTANTNRNLVRSASTGNTQPAFTFGSQRIVVVPSPSAIGVFLMGGSLLGAHLFARRKPI
jgi:hypothetical protein